MRTYTLSPYTPLCRSLAQGIGLQVADVAGEPVVLLVGQLVAGDHDLLGVDYHQVIAGIDVRGEHRLVLATQAVGELGGQAAQGLAGGVDPVPVPLDGLVLCGECLHACSSLGTYPGCFPPSAPRAPSPP